MRALAWVMIAAMAGMVAVAKADTLPEDIDLRPAVIVIALVVTYLLSTYAMRTSRKTQRRGRVR